MQELLWVGGGKEGGREGGREEMRGGGRACRHEVGRTYQRWGYVVVARWGESVAQTPCRLLLALHLRAAAAGGAGTEAVVSS